MTTPSNRNRAGAAGTDGTPQDLHLWKLPRGRHGLPRELVARSQRERLLAGVVRVTAAKGYQATSVADILREAGVGRESFYRHFKDKEDCFIAANDTLVNDLAARVEGAYEQPGAWPERVGRGLATMLDWFATNHEVARVMMIEMGTVGPIGNERFRTIFRRFTTRLDDGRELIDGVPDLPNLASIAGGAVFARIYEEVAVGSAVDLPQLLPQLTFELLLPYMGESAARKEQRRAARALSAG